MKTAATRILVALKQATDAAELIGLAAQVAAPRQAQIVALHVVEIPDPTPLDARDEALEAPARAVEQEVKRLARKHPRRKFSVRLLRARRAGRTIVDELKEGKFELAVIGYHHKRSLSELLLGTTAQYLAEHAPCPLLMRVPARV